MKKNNRSKKNSPARYGLVLLLCLVLTGALHAQQRTWMLPYYQNNGAVNSTGGVDRVPVINFKTPIPTYETRYINNSFSTQTVGNGEYCNNCAQDQITKISQFFISGRAADLYQNNTEPNNRLRTLYAKWEQICGDTARVDTFLTTSHTDLGHESLNEIAVADGETPGTFWVVMQQSPTDDDGFGPGFYVYLMDMNNSSINASSLTVLNHSTYSQLPDGSLSTGSTDGTHGLGEGVALGPKFTYVMQPGETNANLVALNGKHCRSIYVANYNTVYHLLIDLSNNNVVYSDNISIAGVGGTGNMFMEIDMNFPQSGLHPTMLGLTGWSGVFTFSTSPNHGKLVSGSQHTIYTTINNQAGGYGVEFDKLGNYMYYSVQGNSAIPTLYRVNCITFNTAQITLGLTGFVNSAYNNLCLESAIDGNIYGLTTHQELVTITDPELASTTAATYTSLTAGIFLNPVTNAADLNPGNNANFKFGLSLPDWVDGELPLTSTGGTIEIKLPCALCNEPTIKHTVDVYAGTPGNETLVQHYDMYPCENQKVIVCPGVDYHIVFDSGLPTQQDSWVSISFPGDYHLVTFSLSGNAAPYIQYNVNTTITTNTLWDNKVYIAPNVIVTVSNGATLDITNVDVIFGSDAGIDFKNGAIIRANNSVLRPCSMNDVWRGLAFYTTTGNTAPSGMINECTFKNAKTAIEAKGTSGSLLALDLRITNNLFADCQRGIGLNYVDFKRSITGNTYMIENKALPFSSINNAVNPPVTTAPTNQNDYFGIFTNYGGSFHDLISQNDLVMTSDTTNGNQMSYGMSFYNVSNVDVTTNNITDFSYGITSNTTSNISIEDNTLEWSNLYKKVIQNEYKFHISVYYGQNALIKSNRIYSSNLISSANNNTTPTLDGGTGGPSTPTYKSIGINVIGMNKVSVKQNTIIGIETGICAIGTNYSTPSNDLYISENDIQKSWYYGIYLRTYENVDITCNTIDMEFKTSREPTGIGYFNLIISPFYIHPANVVFRSNCILNSKNAIYCYNPGAAGTTNVPRIYNNFLYNYSRVGFENNGFTSVNTATPYDINRNSFVSNNSNSSLPDLVTNTGFPMFGDYNYGVQNTAGGFTLNNGTNGNSTASCALQTSTNANLINSTQTCDYYYATSANWIPAGKASNWPLTAADPSIMSDPFELSDPVYRSLDKIESVVQPKFDMYPVPTSNKVTIAYNLNENDNAYLEFIDIQGKVLKTVQLEFEHTTVDVNVAEFVPGVYIVRLVNEGKSTYYSKLIKQ